MIPKGYDAEVHDLYHCLGLAPELAERLTEIVMEIDGEPQAEVSVILQPRCTKYRGDILIGAVGKKEDKEQHSYVCGLVDLYDIKPCREFSDWQRAAIPPGADRAQWFAWFLRNPRRIIEMPYRLRKDFYTLIIPKGDITVYPRNLKLGEAYNSIRKRYV